MGQKQKVGKTVAAGILATLLTAMRNEGISKKSQLYLIDRVVIYISSLDANSLDEDALYRCATEYIAECARFLGEAEVIDMLFEKIHEAGKGKEH